MKFSNATYQRKHVTELQRKQVEEIKERVRLALLPHNGVIRMDLTEQEKIEQDEYIKLHKLDF